MKRTSGVSDTESRYQQYGDSNNRQPENSRNASPGGTAAINTPANASLFLTGGGPNPGLVLFPPATSTPAPGSFNFPFTAHSSGMALTLQQPAEPQPPLIPRVSVTRRPSITSSASHDPRAVPEPKTNFGPMPVSTATADRYTGAPALQPAAPGQTSSGAQASSIGAGEARSLEGEAVFSRAKQLIRNYNAWMKVYKELSQEEKIRFGVASIDAACELPEQDVRRQWTAMLHLVCTNVGAERLMAKRWPNGQAFTSVLIRLHLHEMLGKVLQTETGKNSLLLADDKGLRPLDHAACYGDAAAPKLILQFDDEDGALRMQSSNKGLLPLHRAAISGAVEVAGLLLSLRSREQRLSAADGNSGLPIHHAISFGASAAVVKLLLADVALEQVTASTGLKKFTALMSAIFFRMPNVMKELLAIKHTLPMQLTIRNANGQTALDMAKETGDEEIIALIEASMKELAPTSTASGSAPTNTAAGIEAPRSTAASHEGARNDPPLPLTPFPSCPQMMTKTKKSPAPERASSVKTSAVKSGRAASATSSLAVHAASRSSSVRATTFVAPRRSSSTRCSSACLAFDSSTVRGPAPYNTAGMPRSL